MGTVDPAQGSRQKKLKKVKKNAASYRFIDRTRVKVQGGSGGNGSLSFAHVGKSYKKRPDGGHGGNGGSVIIVADKREQTLRWSRNHQFAEDGVRGQSQDSFGRGGKNLILKVPCGTIVRRVLDRDEEWDEQNWTVRRTAGAEKVSTGGKFVVHDDGAVEYVHEYDDDFQDIELFPTKKGSLIRKAQGTVDDNESNSTEESDETDSDSDDSSDSADILGVDAAGHRILGEIEPDSDSEVSDETDSDIGEDIDDYMFVRVDSSGHRILGEVDPGSDSDASDHTDSDTDDESGAVNILRTDAAGHRILGEIGPDNDSDDVDDTDTDDDDNVKVSRTDVAGHRILREIDPEKGSDESDYTDSDTDGDGDDYKVLTTDSGGHRILGMVSPGSPSDDSDNTDSDSDNEIDDAERTRVTLADLDTPGSYVVVARGGRGGIGSCAYASSHGPISPIFLSKKSKPGKGETAHLELELKMIADIGLVGFPNAGKSSLLAALSKAMPEIAPYPFTTLHPLIGTIEFKDGYKVLAADVPGLIAGASNGRGKGHDFLRHLERTKALLYIVDSAGTDGRDPYDDLRVLVDELAAYGDGDMLTRPALVVANKLDLLTDSESDEFALELGCIAEELGIRFDGNVFGISAGVTGEGLGPLSRAIRDVVREVEIEREVSFQQGGTGLR